MEVEKRKARVFVIFSFTDPPTLIFGKSEKKYVYIPSCYVLFPWFFATMQILQISKAVTLDSYKRR